MIYSFSKKSFESFSFAYWLIYHFSQFFIFLVVVVGVRLFITRSNQFKFKHRFTIFLKNRELLKLSHHFMRLFDIVDSFDNGGGVILKCRLWV